MKQLLIRIIAVFVAASLSGLGVGEITGIPMWKPMLFAGLSGLVPILVKLLKDYYKDGKLSKAEIDAVFNGSDGQDSQNM